MITITITLILLQFYILNPKIKKKKINEDTKEENGKNIVEEGIDENKGKKSGFDKSFIKNLVALVVLIILLVFIEAYYIVAIGGAIVFVFLNPVNKQKKLKSFSLYHYLNRIDYKLIYFFVCLFIFVGLLQLNGTILMVEKWIESISYENEFILAIVILIITSILSGLLDNAPVTVIFIPIIKILLALPVFYSGPILIAFILGINLGGNFLPQGSAADMMTLELAKYNKVNEVNYKNMFKIGALFSILHIVIGIGYLYVIIYVL
jgi:Na+/H+ antiporter NhaD/arsenite permease-like protein